MGSLQQSEPNTICRRLQTFSLIFCRSVRFMDKRMTLKLNGGRSVTGILRGFDPFMNVVIDETVEDCKDGTRNTIGMVVRIEND